MYGQLRGRMNVLGPYNDAQSPIQGRGPTLDRDG